VIQTYRSGEAGPVAAGRGDVAAERDAEAIWFDVVDPTPEEQRTLARELNVPLDFIADSLDPNQVSLIEKKNDMLLVLVRIPHLESAEASLPYVTFPVGIVATQSWVLTLCRRDHELVSDLTEERRKALSTDHPTRFVLHLLWAVAYKFLGRLNEIEGIVEALEDRLQKSLDNRAVIELLRYQKSLVHFTTSLQGNELILARLRTDELALIEGEDQELLQDVCTEHRQANERVEITANILSNMMDAFASIISNNLNVVMKLLTSVTVVLVVSTVIANLYGMNVKLPFAQHPLAFLVIMGASVVVSLTVALIFWKKGWL
jgi:magnesium transporter